MAKTAAITTKPSDDAILDAARGLVVEEESLDTSMGAIARRASVVRATVYNNFRDKDASLAMIVQRYQQGYAAIPGRLRGKLEAGGHPMGSSRRPSPMPLNGGWQTPRSGRCWIWPKPYRTMPPGMRPTKLRMTQCSAGFAAFAAARPNAGSCMMTLNIQFAGVPCTALDSTLVASDVNASPSMVGATVHELALMVWRAAYQVDATVAG